MKTLSFNLTLATFVLLATTALSSSMAAQQTSGEQDLPVAFRTRVATHYRLPNGSLRAVITIRPQNYRDADGQWHAIDTTLVEGTEHAFVNLTNGLATRFPANPAQGIELEGVNQPSLTMTPVRFAYFDKLGRVVGEAAAQGAFAVRQDSQTVQYPSMFKGVTDEYVVDTDRLKHNLVVSRAALDGMTESDSFGGEFCVVIPSGLTVRHDEGARTIRLLNGNGECVYEIGSVFAVDAIGKTVNGSLQSRMEDGNLFVTMSISTGWAMAEERQWPVRIDPTFSVQPDAVVGKDTHVRDGAPNENRGTYADITVNWGSNANQEALVQFDLTSIPAQSSVSTAQFEAWHRSNTVTGHIWELNEITATWDELTVTWATKPTYNATPATTLTYVNGSPLVWRTYLGLGALAQQWVASPATNYGFRMFNTTNPNASAYHRSSDYATATERPKFEADYISNVPPSIELPTAGSSFTGTFATGYTASVPPATLSGLDLELVDVDLDAIDIVSATVVPSAPGGIVAPPTGAANPSGTVISFTGDASQALPGSYTYTITIDDTFGPVSCDVTLNIADEAPSNAAGPNATSGDGSIANPYTGEVGIGGTPVADLAIVTDLNVPQTLTQVSVTPDGSNPSSVFQVAYSGTGNSGGISATATSVVTYLDLGDHVFTVTVTDGTNPIDVVVRVTVLNVGNVQPSAGTAGGSFTGTRAGGFTLTVNPGQALSGASLSISDADFNDIEVLNVQVAPAAGMLGVTAPTASVAAAGPFTIAWTGTADATEVPGSFVYTITISDGVTPPLDFTATITLADIAPQQVPATGVTGDGSVALPYAFITQVGKTPAFDVCNVSDQNLSQTVTLVSVTPDALNPTGGAGFDVALTGTLLSMSALGTLKSDDVGTHVFTANLTDGTNNIQVVMRVKVNTIPGDKPEGGGCSGTTGSSVLWLLLVLGGALAAVRIRTARE